MTGLLSRRYQEIILHAFFLWLLGMSVYFYRERLFADCAYYLLHAVDGEWFHVEHQRLVLAISQVLPLIGVKLGLDMTTVLILYSIGHVLFHYACFAVCLFTCRDLRAAAAVTALQVTGTVWLYYSPMLEICYGAALLFVFYALLRKTERFTGSSMAALLILELFIITSHPENFIIFLSAVTMHAADKGFMRKVHLPFLALFAAVMLFKFVTFSEYEGAKVAYAFDPSAHRNYLNLFNPQYLGNLSAMFAQYYAEVWIFFLMSVVYYLLRKQWIKSLATFLFFTGTVMLINVTGIADFFGRYNESMYFPLVSLALLPFLFDVAADGRRLRPAFFALLCGVMLFRIAWIARHGEAFTQRIAQLERLIAHCHTMEGSKFTVDERNIAREYAMVGWSHPIETMLLSAENGKEATVNLVTTDDLAHEDNAGRLRDDDYLFRRWDVRKTAGINSKYFRLENGPYVALNTAFPDTILPGGPWESVSLKIPSLPAGPWKSSSTVYLPVEITYGGAGVLHSAPEGGIALSCRWKKGDIAAAGEGLRTPLEVDVRNRYAQDMTVLVPAAPGSYTLEAGLITYGGEWLVSGGMWMVEVQ